MPDLIGTLAMDLVYRGFALVLAKGLVLARFPELITEIGRGQVFYILPTPVLIGILSMIGGYFVLTRTYFGRYTIAIGSNPDAADMTGVSVDRHRVYAYVLMGAMAGLAGIMLTGKLNAIQATSAPYFNLHVIAAVVVGGTSLFGGRASMLGSFAGVLLLSMMINALVTLRIEFFWQSVASGVVNHHIGRRVHLAAENRPRWCARHQGGADQSRQRQDHEAGRHAARPCSRFCSSWDGCLQAIPTPAARPHSMKARAFAHTSGRRKTMKVISKLALAAALTLSTSALAMELPLKTLPDDGDRDYWLPQQVNKDGALEALQAKTGAPAVKYTGTQEKPLQIALIYPSADVSDFLGAQLSGNDQAS